MAAKCELSQTSSRYLPVMNRCVLDCGELSVMTFSSLGTSAPMQDFPYNYEADVEHHNIWSTVPLGEQRVLEVSHPLALGPCQQLCRLQRLCCRSRRKPVFLWYLSPLVGRHVQLSTCEALMCVLMTCR